MMKRNNFLACLSIVAVVTGAEGCDEPIDGVADVDDVGDEQEGAEDDEEAAEDAAEDAPALFPAPLGALPRESEAGTVWHSTSQACVTAGGGTWGSILKLCLNLVCYQDGTEGNLFTVTKKDGSTFTTPGTFYLRQDTKTGTTHKSTKYYTGAKSPSLTDDLYKWVPLGGYLDYYAYLASDGGGYAWVGPLRVYEKIYP